MYNIQKSHDRKKFFNVFELISKHPKYPIDLPTSVLCQRPSKQMMSKSSKSNFFLPLIH